MSRLDQKRGASFSPLQNSTLPARRITDIFIRFSLKMFDFEGSEVVQKFAYRKPPRSPAFR
jgi:hypothetical protein